MSVSLGTSTIETATAYSSGRHIVKSSNGTLVLFAYISDTTIAYKTSSDDGATWSVSWTNIETGSGLAGQIDAYIDTTDDIYLVYYMHDGYNSQVSFRKLTYSTGSWTIGSRKQISSTVGGNKASITKRSNGDLWICFEKYYRALHGYYSTDDGANWTDTYVSTIGEDAIVGVFPYGTDIRVVMQQSQRLTYFDYTTTWSSGTEFHGAASLVDDTKGLGFLKIDDSNIYVAIRTYSGIRVFKWSGSSWDSGTLLSNNSNDQLPHIINVNNNPVVIWKDYDGTYYNISYRYWNGSSWDTQVDITSDTAVDSYPSGVTYDSTNLYICWTTGASNPYTIYFTSVNLNPTKTKTILSDTKIKATDIQKSIASDTKIVDLYQKNINSNTAIKAINIQSNIFSNTKIKSTDNAKTITSDAIITNTVTKTIPSDTKIKATDIQKTIISDTLVIMRNQTNILSDTKISATGVQKTILSNAKVVIQVIYDIINKFNFTKCVLNDINIKINTCKAVISNIASFISICKSTIMDVNNDIRTKKLTLNNINNDIRFLASWQVTTPAVPDPLATHAWQTPGIVTFKSLGKEYIKVYIGGLEETTVDVDSIEIYQILNEAHTASFNLSKVYDSTKPTIKSTVSIKYSNWVLYTGYITGITPGDSPESMKINCQDKYWLDNLTDVAYIVGEEMISGVTYTIPRYISSLTALTTVHSWNPGTINSFRPEQTDYTGKPAADAITDLITDCGNFAWYYNVYGTKKLWVGGVGSIINLKRQVVGENIELYDVLSHSFTDDITGIINQYHVEMGPTTRKYAENSASLTKEKTSYYEFYSYDLTPAWDPTLEILTTWESSSYGYNFPDPGINYDSVYTTYYLPGLDEEKEAWSDERPPIIRVEYPQVWPYDPAHDGQRGPEVWYSYSDDYFGKRTLWGPGHLIDGYTIDYDNDMVILSSPMYRYWTNESGTVTKIVRPIITVWLLKRNIKSVTYTPTPPPDDSSTEMSFFTSKVGTYPDTIIKDLSLSNLSIQIGTTIYNGTARDEDGTTIYLPNSESIEHVPSWNDIAFAKDIAYWKLSNTCEKLITGTITVTLDAVCYYNIDLTKRINISGITEDAMNIKSMSYNLSNFTVSIELENNRFYNRTVSKGSQ